MSFESKNYIIHPLTEMFEYKEILDTLRDGQSPISITGPSDSQKTHISYAISTHLGLKGIFITHNELHARKVYDDLAFFYENEVVFFPSREIMFYDVEARSHEVIFERLNALNRIIEGNYRFIVTSAEAISSKLISKEYFIKNIININFDDKIDLQEFSSKLMTIGYERVSLIEDKGQFTVRGGIIDIFPINFELPIRIELFDDEIDSIRSFDIDSQRSINKLDNLKIIPAKEIIYSPLEKTGILEAIQKDITEFIKKISLTQPQKTVEQVHSELSKDIDKLKTNYYFPAMDKYIPYILAEPSAITDYLDNETIIFLDEISKFEQKLEHTYLENNETCKILIEKGKILPKSFEIYFDAIEIKNKISQKSLAILNTFNTLDKNLPIKKNFNIISKTLGSYQGHVSLIIEDIKRLKSRGYKVIILSGTRAKGEKLIETFRSENIECTYTENNELHLKSGQIIITHGNLNYGFEYPNVGFVVISDTDIFGSDKHKKKHLPKKKGKKINVFTDLNIGDYVVHQAHGIGQYVGIQTLIVENTKKDYLKVKYHGNDNLYIPANQLELLQKYIGSEGNAPKLNKLGGIEWTKAKNKVKESLQELAKELMTLYAKRETSEGIQYGKDTVWQKQFEEMFPYEETEDQLKCIEEIKKDMESSKPMDRLLCGDVGYGKTEVAIRAIFKAVLHGKQVAYLVPTTILAQQQYNNFKKRMQDFPVTVDLISRFNTPTEQRNILKTIKNGMTDVVVGTHRLIQKDIKFKDLGLLVIDEEQRFGVNHKEKLKNLRHNVDILTLSATPIPRTLHMSLVGIKDISTIQDPPGERYPIQTYVMEYNQDVIREAILRELSRNGQVFYLHNNIKHIDLKASELNKLIPEAKIGIAHGRMNEEQLEGTMFKFLNREYDILVCTTIIESGLDMPNVNTIIVENADAMGLAQLYQLRGRVGRSNKLAYAYITHKADKVLTEIAQKRLQAIKDFTEFGSGFKIAMRDLEIRGAGNLIGAAQHGHMESVGYDMYCRLLEEAIREQKGEATSTDSFEITIDINMMAYIDDNYINVENQKIEMYKKIASISDEDDVNDIQDELLDRYGDIPKAVNNLIQIAYLKTLGKACNFTSIQEKTDSIVFTFTDNTVVNIELLGKLMSKYKRELLFTASNKPYLTYIIKNIPRESLLENIKILLQDIIKLQLEK